MLIKMVGDETSPECTSLLPSSSLTRRDTNKIIVYSLNYSLHGNCLPSRNSLSCQMSNRLTSKKKKKLSPTFSGSGRFIAVFTTGRHSPYPETN
jgi:hypothetical protein